MTHEGCEFETILAWRTLCQLQGLLEDCDATIRINIDHGAIQASASITLDLNDSESTDYVNAEGADLAVTLLALASAAHARLIQASQPVEMEGR